MKYKRVKGSLRDIKKVGCTSRTVLKGKKSIERRAHVVSYPYSYLKWRITSSTSTKKRIFKNLLVSAQSKQSDHRNEYNSGTSIHCRVVSRSISLFIAKYKAPIPFHMMLVGMLACCNTLFCSLLLKNAVEEPVKEQTMHARSTPDKPPSIPTICLECCFSWPLGATLWFLCAPPGLL